MISSRTPPQTISPPSCFTFSIAFIRSSTALVLTSAIGVALGAVLAEVINPRMMNGIAGAGFLVIGAWMLAQGFRA